MILDKAGMAFGEWHRSDFKNWRRSGDRRLKELKDFVLTFTNEHHPRNTKILPQRTHRI